MQSSGIDRDAEQQMRQEMAQEEAGRAQQHDTATTRAQVEERVDEYVRKHPEEAARVTAARADAARSAPTGIAGDAYIPEAGAGYVPSSGPLRITVSGGRVASSAADYDAYYAGISREPRISDAELASLNFAQGVADAVVQTVYQPVAMAVDVGRVAYETARSVVTGQGPRDIEYLSGLGQMALAGAGTGDIIVGGLKGAVMTPVRLGEALADGDAYAVGQEFTNLSMLMYGGREGSPTVWARSEAGTLRRAISADSAWIWRGRLTRH